MFYFTQFYRKYGTRKIANFIKPIIMDSKEVMLPIESVLHWSKISDIVVNPTKDYGYFNKLSGRMFVNTVFEYTDTELHGKFRHLGINTMGIVNKMSHSEKTFTFVKPSASHINMSRKDLMVVNYGCLNHMYKYSIAPLNDYYKYLNVMTTLIDNCVSGKYVTDRNIFVTIDIPPVLPTRQLLDKYLTHFTRSTLNVLTDSRYFNLLEFWKYLTPEHRSESIFSKVPQDQLEKINLLLSFDNKLVLLNLKVLVSTVAEYNTDSTLAKTTKYKANTIRKIFYVMLYRIVNGKSETFDSIANDKDDKDISITLSGIIKDTSGERESESIDIDNLLEHTIVEKEDVFEPAENDLDNSTDDIEVITTSSEINNAIENTSIGSGVSTVEELYDIKYDSATKLNLELTTLKDAGLISKKEVERIEGVLENQKTASSPYESDKVKVSELLDTVSDSYDVSKEDCVITDNPAVLDKEHNKLILRTIEKKYITTQLKKDLVRTVFSIQNSGNIIEDYKVVETDSILGETESHEFKVSTLNGRPSNIKILLPKVRDDGTIKLSGNVYTLRPQRSDLPIRKIARDMVALSSSYGKLFISKATYKKNDFGYWFRRELLKRHEVDAKLKDLVLIEVSNIDTNLPDDYNFISRYVKSFKYDETVFSFEYDSRKKLIKNLTDDILTDIEENSMVLVGSNNNTPVVMGLDNKVYKYVGKKYIEVDDLFTMLGINKNAGPVEYTNIRIYKEQFPVGFLLAYYLGLDTLLKILSPDYTIEEVGKRISGKDFVLTFKNKTLVFNRKDSISDMVFYGLSTLNDALKNVNYETMNTKSKYSTIFAQLKLSVLYINEIKLLEEMFIDPITYSILNKLNMPLNFTGLLLKATELLKDDNYTNPNNITQMTIKGYERIAGMMYGELVNSIKEHRNRSFFSRSKLTIYPYSVINKITEDSTTVLLDDLNPMTIIKQNETITYLGVGGRSKEGMSRSTREMHSSEIGIVSEASPDSGDVGVSANLTANPNIDNTRGILKDFNVEENGFASIVSTSAMLAPFALNEDVKRLNFSNVMNSHIIPMTTMRAPFVRTGYETIIPIKAEGKYIKLAKMEGVITKLTSNEIEVTYVDKTKESFNLASWTTKEESGACYTHTMVTALNKGDTVVKDDTITYTSSFFEPDVFNRKRVLYKSGTYVNVGLMEDIQTYEDSAAISSKMNKVLATTVTKVKSTVVSNTDAVLSIKLPGTKLEPSDVLFTITDGAIGNTNGLDERTLSILQDLKNISPKAKVRGVISKIVVYYNCEIESLSPSLKELVRISDEALIKETKHTGKVSSNYSINGNPLLDNQVEIKTYIHVNDNMGIGDKAILGNQLKFTVGEVYNYDMKTLAGDEIDLLFSQKSISARIVNSPALIGTTSTLLSVITEKCVNEYFN
jgi:hypothetical protein